MFPIVVEAQLCSSLFKFRIKASKHRRGSAMSGEHCHPLASASWNPSVLGQKISKWKRGLEWKDMFV